MFSKRKGKGKHMTRERRLRLEKAMQRAEVVLDQTERKVEKSKNKGKTVYDRRVCEVKFNQSTY